MTGGRAVVLGLAAMVALLVAGAIVVIHRVTHRTTDGDAVPDPADEELLAAVRGLGAERHPDPDAQSAAATLDEWDDLRGARDRDPDAPNPWRAS